MKPFNNIPTILMTAAIVAILITACTHDNGPVQDPGLCPVTSIDVNFDTDATRATGANGTVVTAFAVGDVINIGTTTMKASYKTDGALEWKLQGTIYIDPAGNQTISATYTPAADVKKPKADGHSTYYDHLTASASIAAGTITVDQANNTASIKLNFAHTNSLAVVTKVTDDKGTALAGDVITAIDLILTEGGVERKIAIDGTETPVIIPTGATLTAVEVTPKYQTTITAKFAGTGFKVVARKRYPMAITLTRNTATVTFQHIESWRPEAVTIPQGYDYAILTAADLVSLAATVNAGNNLAGKKVIQMTDIDMAAVSNWTPIGAAPETPFVGLYNGNGCSIINLKADKLDYAGLFGYVKGVADDYAIIANTHLRSCNITGSTAGALTGYAERAVIATCSSSGTVEGYDYAGGLAGIAENNTHITRSRSSCTVLGAGTSGGLVALNTWFITACTASGRVTGKNYAGGLVGDNRWSIVICYATGGARSTDNQNGVAGGLVGRMQGRAVNCYATGEVAGGAYCGTLAGNAVGDSFTNCHALPGPTVGSGSAVGISSAGLPAATVRANGATYPTRTVCAPATGLEIGQEERTFIPSGTWNTESYPTLNFAYEGAK